MLGIAIFGGDEWGKYKEASKIAERVSSGEMILKDSKGNVITDPNKATSYAMEHPNEARVQSESQKGWAGQQKAIDASFGGGTKTRHIGSMDSLILMRALINTSMVCMIIGSRTSMASKIKKERKSVMRVNAVLSAQKKPRPCGV